MIYPTNDSSKRLIQRMSGALALSFGHIFEQSEHSLQIDEGAKKTLLSRLHNGSRESPALYAHHFVLINQIQQDDLVSAQVTINQILLLSPTDTGTLSIPLGAPKTPVGLSIILPFLAEGEDARFSFFEPKARQADLALKQIGEALQMLREGALPFHSEISEIVPWIVVAAGKPTEINEDPESSFDGASALRAFGSVLQNVSLQNSVFDRALSLVHETSHHVLFAHSPKDGVVTNSPEELYSSPLRVDPRPMEGIHHATFVLARMALVAKLLLESGLLSKQDNELARETIADSRTLFADGMETLDQHAAYTPPGAQAIAEAQAFMASL